MKQRPQSGGSQLSALGIQKVGRERRASRVLVLRIQLCHFEFRTTPNDAQRHDAAAYQMRTGTQNLLYPSTLSDPAASASGVRRKPGSFQASSALPLLSRKRRVAAQSDRLRLFLGRSLRRLTVDFRSEKPVHGGLSATTRLRLVPWWRLPAGRARRPCE